MDTAQPSQEKRATAARIYDYFLGGTHNFPADRAAAQEAIRYAPRIPAAARANRAFLRRAVHLVAEAGVRQFLDIGSGIPTEGNVHEIAQSVYADTRVVYVDIDPVAVAEGQELLDGNKWATSIRGDVRDVPAILSHRKVTQLLDFSEPIALVTCALLHFVSDDDVANSAMAQLRDAVCPGSYLILSHVTPDRTVEGAQREAEQDVEKAVQDTYTRATSTPLRFRERDEVASFFTGFDLIEPGLVWVSQWRSEPNEDELGQSPHLSAAIAGVGVRR